MKTGCLFLCLEVRKSNVFEAVKQAVPTRQAAEFYGVQVGRNGMACCPFHEDKHPSMKVDRRFHCFGCQADGDVIDFTARLFGLNKKEAALKLAEDFSVSFDAKGHDPPRRRPVKRKISEELRYRQAEQKCFRVLCDYLHLLGERVCPTDAGGNMEPAVCGGPSKKAVHGVSAGYSAVRQYGGTGLRGR